MEIKWRILLTKISIWLFLEIFLNFIGLDTIADYGEFVFHKSVITRLKSAIAISV